MNVSPDPHEMREEASVLATLNAADRSEIRSRVYVGVFIAGAVGLVVWFYTYLWSCVVSNTAIVFGMVAVIAAMATWKLKDQMTKNTRYILRAIAELDTESGGSS